MHPAPENDDLTVEETEEAPLDDGFGALRELLTSEDEVVVGDDEVEEPVSAAEYATLADELTELRAEHGRLVEALTEERAVVAELRRQLDALDAVTDEPEATYDGPERRAGGADLRSDADRLSQGERRRGLRPRDGGRQRPLRVRRDDVDNHDVDNHDVDNHDVDNHDVDNHDVDGHELMVSGWSDRLRDVAASGDTWTDDDVERLRSR